MKNNIRFWSYLAEFLEWEIFHTKIVEKMKTHFMVNFFPKILPFISNVEKYSRAGEATDDNMAYAHFTPVT